MNFETARSDTARRPSCHPARVMVFLLGWAFVPAEAATDTFLDRAAFETALAVFELEDFQALAGTNLCNPFSASGPFCGAGPVELDAGALNLKGRAQPYITPGGVLTDPELRFAVSGGGELVTGAQPGFQSNFFFTLEVASERPLTAFGSDTRFWVKDIELTLIDELGAAITDDAVVVSPPAGEVGFFGIVSDVPFTTVRIRAGNDDFVNYDNFTYQVVPVPPALWLFASALAGLTGITTRPRGPRVDAA